MGLVPLVFCKLSCIHTHTHTHICARAYAHVYAHTHKPRCIFASNKACHSLCMATKHWKCIGK